MKLLEICLFGMPIEIWALIISIIAVIFTLMKDFILPCLLKPKIKFEYNEERPFRRECDVTNSNEKLCFLRFSVNNFGNRPALNCRCQILTVEKNSKNHGDYQGFPLKWAGRPELLERLNIAIGETEFIDIVYTTNNDNSIHLQTYHNVGIGISSIIDCGEYLMTLIFSGDNFKPYKLKFKIVKENNNNHNKISLSLIDITQ